MKTWGLIYWLLSSICYGVAADALASNGHSLETTTPDLTVSIAQSRVLGILNTCQNYYDGESDGFFSRLILSRRNIIAGITDNYDHCEQSIADFKQDSFAEIAQTLEGVEHIANSSTLDFINRNLLSGIIGSLFINQQEYGATISEDTIFAKVKNCYRKREFGQLSQTTPLLAQTKIEMTKFKRIIAQHPLPEKTATTLQLFKVLGNELNQSCQAAHGEYAKSSHKKCQSINYHSGLCGRYTRYAENFWANKQSEMQGVLVKFQQKYPQQSRLFIAQHFDRKILLFNQHSAKSCALGEKLEVFNSRIAKKDIEQSANQLQDLMYIELAKSCKRQKIVHSESPKKIHREIKNILKYQPHLMASYLHHIEGDAQKSADAARYICKTSLEIYDSDELWNKVELGLDAASLLALGTVALVPGGAGILLSGGVAVTAGVGATVAGARISSVVKRLRDIFNARHGVKVRVAQGVISPERHQSEKDRIDVEKNWVMTNSALWSVGAFGVLKGGSKIVAQIKHRSRVNSSKPGKGALDAKLPSPVDEAALRRFSHVNEHLAPKLEFAKKNLQYVIDNANGALLFHGSGSSSLLAFTANRSLGGLRPAGEILKNGRAPYSGELWNGISGSVAKPKVSGINQDHVSTTKITDLDLAMGYLSRNNFSRGGRYSPKDSSAELAELKGYGEQYLSPDLLRTKIAIEQRRIEQWNALSRKDKKLVEENFPVLYGLNPGKVREVEVHFLAKLKAEVSVKGGFDFTEIRSIFVPENKVKLIREILHKQGIDHIKVSPIERIEQVYQATKGH